MNIELERLTLREYQISDFTTVHTYGADPDFSQYESWGPNSEQDTKDFIDLAISNSQVTPRFTFDMAVCLTEENLQIGGCGLRRESENSQVANMGWSITPSEQGNGYATEAASALIEFGFRELNLTVIYATCDTRNEASMGVMENIGMNQVGLLKNDRSIGGQTYDSYRYEILPGLRLVKS